MYTHEFLFNPQIPRKTHNSYNWSELDLLHGTGRNITHRYVHSTKRWEAAEAKAWRLLERSAIDIPLERSVTEICGRTSRHAYYQAALVSGHVTEVPRLVGGSAVFVNYDVDIPGVDNHTGSLIHRLRHLFYWRAVWDPGSWQLELTETATSLSMALERLAARSCAAADYLARREDHCRSLAAAIANRITPLSPAPVLDEVTALASNGDWENVLVIVRRWLPEDLLTIDQQRELRRWEIRALLKSDHVSEAQAAMHKLLNDGSAHTDDFLLGARYYYDAEDYAPAARLMHQALDAGADAQDARHLGLQIAGKAGDSSLVARLRT